MSSQSSMRVVFFGSPPFAVSCFEHLCRTRFRPVLLVTQPDKAQGRGRRIAANPLTEIAERIGVERRACADASERSFLESLQKTEPDWIVVVSFGQILKRAFLDLPKQGVLNVHASVLPRWRGASPIAAAIRSGDERSGLSVQRVVQKLDAGPVCARLEIGVPPRATAGELQALLAHRAGSLLESALLDLQAGRAAFVDQDERDVTYAPKLSKASGRIAWESAAEDVDRLVRSVTPWPGAWTYLPIREISTEVRVLRGRPDVATSAAEPGTLVRAEEGDILVACGGAHAYRIEELQVANGKPLDAAAFLRGRHITVGERSRAPST